MVSPIEGHTKLRLERDGLDIIRQLKGPVSPVVVIGPYRSGKSFLLNQLLGVGCGDSPLFLQPIPLLSLASTHCNLFSAFNNNPET